MSYTLATWMSVSLFLKASRSMMGSGLGTFRKSTYRLMNQGSHTFDSYEMYSEVGTEKTSATSAYTSAGETRDIRSISSSVSCLVSRTKQKIITQATRFNPA
jgi:hypothetical protein